MAEEKIRVFLLDDHEVVRRGVADILSGHPDITVVGEGKNAAEAMSRVPALRPDVAILDLHLPPTLDAPDTGLRILDYVKSHLPASKVFVASSDPSGEMRRECVRRGADGFFDKPLDVERLVATVRRTAVARRLVAA